MADINGPESSDSDTSTITPGAIMTKSHTISYDGEPIGVAISDFPETIAATGVSGPLPSQMRASPSPAIPNGKPASPYMKESTPAMQPIPQTISSKDPKAAAAAASDMRNVVRRKLTGYVGFANLPNQWHRKSVRKGFNFNVMVVGRLEFHIFKVHTDNQHRRVWTWKVDFGQHSLQYFTLPSS